LERAETCRKRLPEAAEVAVSALTAGARHPDIEPVSAMAASIGGSTELLTLAAPVASALIAHALRSSILPQKPEQRGARQELKVTAACIGHP